MPSRPTKVDQTTREERARRAYGIMAEIRANLFRRFADYVVEHERSIRAESVSEESYSYHLNQMEEQFLTKLNIVERAVAELSRPEPREGVPTTTTYETVEVVAKRDELPQKIADTLADHGDSDLLSLSVLRIDETQAEVLLVLAKEDPVGLEGESPREDPSKPNGERGPFSEDIDPNLG